MEYLNNFLRSKEGGESLKNKKVIEEISYVNNKRYEELYEIKRANRKNYIYGASRAAAVLYKWLSEYGIDIEAFVVDEQYYEEGKELLGLPVFSIASLDDAEKISLIIGFESAVRAREVCTFGVKNAEVFWIEDPFNFHDFSYDFFLKHVEQYQASYDLLEDDLSRNIFIEALRARVRGSSDDLVKYKSQSKFTYDFELLDMNTSDVLVDCGAYTGDTIDELEEYLKGKEKDEKFAHVYAFEPDEGNADKILEKYREEQVTVIRKGLGKTVGNVKFYADNSLYSNVVDSNMWGENTRRDLYGDQEVYTEIEISTLDIELKNLDVSVIKMDIEGSELDALIGAREIIDRCFPKLAICIYHKGEDFYTLIQEIHRHDTENRRYRYYLRHHSDDLSETVLYALPDV